MMKKIALLFVFSCFAMSAFSQDDDFRFGFHFSPTFTWLGNNADNDAISSSGTRMAFKIGADGEYYFRENYALKAGLAMTFGQGGTLKFNKIGDDVKLFKDSQPDLEFDNGASVGFNYQYIEIPFGLKMRTNEMGYFRYFAEIPVFTLGINTAARGKFNNNDFKISKDSGFMQISWGLGGGAEYAVSPNTSIVAGIYFQQGIINTYYAKSGVADVDNSKTRVNGIEVRLGVLF